MVVWNRTFEAFGYEVYAWATLFESNMEGGTLCKAGVSWGESG